MSELLLTLRPRLLRSLYLETTSRCNSLCETCILTFGGREPQRDLRWDEFRRVVDQFPDLLLTDKQVRRLVHHALACVVRADVVSRRARYPVSSASSR